MSILATPAAAAALAFSCGRLSRRPMVRVLGREITNLKALLPVRDHEPSLAVA